MLQISEIVKKIEEMFDRFNQHFYNGELTRPAVSIGAGVDRLKQKADICT